MGSEYSTVKAKEGSRSMFSGLLPGEGNKAKTSEWRGLIYVPSSGSPKLELYYSLQSEANLVSVELGNTKSEPLVGLSSEVFSNDTTYCYLFDDGYNRVLKRFLWEEISGDRAWTMATADISSYKGKVVGLWCGIFNDGSDLLSSMFVDQVQVVAIE